MHSAQQREGPSRRIADANRARGPHIAGGVLGGTGPFSCLASESLRQRNSGLAALIPELSAQRHVPPLAYGLPTLGPMEDPVAKRPIARVSER
jgi:hypothetical protein